MHNYGTISSYVDFINYIVERYMILNKASVDVSNMHISKTLCILVWTLGLMFGKAQGKCGWNLGSDSKSSAPIQGVMWFRVWLKNQSINS